MRDGPCGDRINHDRQGKKKGFSQGYFRSGDRAHTIWLGDCDIGVERYGSGRCTAAAGYSDLLLNAFDHYDA